MFSYNAGDIISTEELFWNSNHLLMNMPNFSTYYSDEGIHCHCGSVDIAREDKDWYTNTGRFEKFRCNECGALIRGKTNLLSKSKKSNFLVRL